MQKLLLTILVLFLLVGNFGYSQSNLEKLTEIRSNLLAELQAVEKEIEKEVSSNGYEVVLDQSLTVKEFPGTGKTVAQLSKGDKIHILGKESIYYKVKAGGVLGFAFLTGISIPESAQRSSAYTSTPAKLFEAPAAEEQPKKTGDKACGATQCSGQTKKGARCKNRTTNCSGRCHLH